MNSRVNSSAHCYYFTDDPGEYTTTEVDKTRACCYYQHKDWIIVGRPS